jgi:hypothetical protein
MVRTKRLELLQLAPLEPKSSVSTNFTTSALKLLKQRRRIVKSGAFSEYGVDDGDRTHDNRSHNPVLYQLSYAHHIAFVALLVPKLPNGAPGRTRTCDHPLRRRMLYPAELRALFEFAFFTAYESRASVSRFEQAANLLILSDLLHQC